MLRSLRFKKVKPSSVNHVPNKRTRFNGALMGTVLFLRHSGSSPADAVAFCEILLLDYVCSTKCHFSEPHRRQYLPNPELSVRITYTGSSRRSAPRLLGSWAQRRQRFPSQCQGDAQLDAMTAA
ncbi:hypothetical protein MHYP_G00074140 [Metynnis hypsauchen]